MKLQCWTGLCCSSARGGGQELVLFRQRRKDNPTHGNKFEQTSLSYEAPQQDKNNVCMTNDASTGGIRLVYRLYVYAYAYIPFGEIRMKSLSCALAGKCVVQEKTGKNSQKSASWYQNPTKTR